MLSLPPELSRNLYIKMRCYILKELFSPEQLNNLTDMEKTIIQYSTSHLKKFYTMSIQELAQNTFSSTSTIMRLCKKLHFDGFNEFKYFICYHADLKKEQNQDYYILNSIISKHVSDLKQTAFEIDKTQIEQTISYFLQDKKLHFFARGLSYMPTFYMYNMLLSVDCNCFFHIDPPLMYHAAAHMDETDILIIGSSGGVTSPIVTAAATAKQHHAVVIAFCSDKTSPLFQIADICFYCMAENRRYKDIDAKSRLSIMFVMDLILECYFEKLNLKSDTITI